MEPTAREHFAMERCPDCKGERVNITVTKTAELHRDTTGLRTVERRRWVNCQACGAQWQSTARLTEIVVDVVLVRHGRKAAAPAVTPPRSSTEKSAPPRARSPVRRRY